VRPSKSQPVDGADGLGPALPEDDARVLADVLRVADEAEAAHALVAGAQVLPSLHAQDCRRLPQCSTQRAWACQGHALAAASAHTREDVGEGAHVRHSTQN